MTITISFEGHLDDFISAYNFARRLKTGPYTLRIHMQKMDRRAGKVYPKSKPSNTGTKQVFRFMF